MYCSALYGFFFVSVKLVYWYLVLGCGLLDPVCWFFELLSHWYKHREYGEWYNLYSVYLFTVGLALPPLTYFCC